MHGKYFQTEPKLSQINGTRILRFRLKLLILEVCTCTDPCFYIYRLPSKKRLIWGPTKSNPIYLSIFWQAIPLMSLSTLNILWADKLRKIPSLYTALLAVNKGNTSKLSRWGFNSWEPDKKDVTLLQIMVLNHKRTHFLVKLRKKETTNLCFATVWSLDQAEILLI